MTTDLHDVHEKPALLRRLNRDFIHRHPTSSTQQHTAQSCDLSANARLGPKVAHGDVQCCRLLKYSAEFEFMSRAEGEGGAEATEEAVVSGGGDGFGDAGTVG